MKGLGAMWGWDTVGNDFSEVELKRGVVVMWCCAVLVFSDHQLSCSLLVTVTKAEFCLILFLDSRQVGVDKSIMRGLRWG